MGLYMSFSGEEFSRVEISRVIGKMLSQVQGLVGFGAQGLRSFLCSGIVHFFLEADSYCPGVHQIG